nr:hypothetical protein [Candidatus Sigynarchaeota archaeon]
MPRAFENLPHGFLENDIIIRRFFTSVETSPVQRIHDVKHELSHSPNVLVINGEIGKKLVSLGVAIDRTLGHESALGREELVDRKGHGEPAFLTCLPTLVWILALALLQGLFVDLPRGQFICAWLCISTSFSFRLDHRARVTRGITWIKTFMAPRENKHVGGRRSRDGSMDRFSASMLFFTSGIKFRDMLANPYRSIKVIIARPVFLP